MIYVRSSTRSTSVPVFLIQIQYVVYAYNIQQQSTLNIEKNWDELEAYAKNKKQTNLLIQLIDKLKHKTFIKYYNQLT